VPVVVGLGHCFDGVCNLLAVDHHGEWHANSKLTSMRGSGRDNTVAWQRVGGAYVKVTMVTVALLRVNDSEAQHGLLRRGRPRDPPYHLGFKESYFAHPPPRPGRPLDGSVMRSMRTRASGSFRKGPASDGDTRNRMASRSDQVELETPHMALPTRHMVGPWIPSEVRSQDIAFDAPPSRPHF
jgi:hypothetical protein